ncbi:MAG TPA: heat-inducible transcriptional repressor HrcA [Candidatus Hydrogenedens sp.]|jgi:heat-inducible transcriptional repressor|nr:heat-inducible transcriptional repressor HrcA [Candidatus Hydrogenedens sp.]
MNTKFPPLNERERTVLEAVVHIYITTAEPVGSRTVVKKLGLNLSPATIRNVMADLEEMGYLTQVHTSSGRVPTDMGYKYYVTHLMKVQELTLAEREHIKQELTKKMDSADQILRQTSHLLALASHQAGLAELPAESTAVIRHVELVPLLERQVAILIVDSFGCVHTSSVILDSTVSTQLLESLNKFLNESLLNVSIDNIYPVVRESLRKFFDERRKLVELALKILTQVEPPANQMFLDGTNNLFDQPEFQESTKVRSIIGIMEDPSPLVKALRESLARSENQKRTVLIGSETMMNNINEFGIIASPYRLEEQEEPAGFIGILGPKRMPYERLSSIVDYTAGMVGKMLSRLWR